MLFCAWQTKLARSSIIQVGLLCPDLAALFDNLIFGHCHFWPPQSCSQSFFAQSDLVAVIEGWVRFGDQILVTALAMLLLASSTQLLLLALLSSDLIVVGRGLGGCSTVLSGLDLEEETVKPALLQLPFSTSPGRLCLLTSNFVSATSKTNTKTKTHTKTNTKTKTGKSF